MFTISCVFRFYFSGKSGVLGNGESVGFILDIVQIILLVSLLVILVMTIIVLRSIFLS